MKKTISLLLTVLISLSVCLIAFPVTSYAEKFNKYEYSLNYLKNYLLAEGDYDNEYDQFFICNTINDYDLEYDYYVQISYDRPTDFVYLCGAIYDFYEEEPFLSIFLDLSDTEDSLCDLTSVSLIYDPNTGEYNEYDGKYNFNPKTYKKGTVYDFELTDKYGTFHDSEEHTNFSGVISLGFDIFIPLWNNLLIDCANITLGNLNFITYCNENSNIYPQAYPVTFNANGHGFAPDSQNIIAGTCALKPSNPYASGYSFGGWYKESECINPWNFETDKVTKATTLYAKWVESLSSGTIKISSDKTFSYRSRVTINATGINIPSNFRLAMYIDDKKVAEGTNKEITYQYGELKSDVAYEIKVLDSNGNIQKNSNGTEFKSVGHIKCAKGFFEILIAFFKGLFGRLPMVEVKP